MPERKTRVIREILGSCVRPLRIERNIVMIQHVSGAIAPKDRAIAHAVAETIAHDIPIPMPHIDVVAEDGCVTLRGAVTCDLERCAAENAARRTQGVRSVTNQIVRAAR